MTTADTAGHWRIRLPARGRPKQAPHLAVARKIGTILRPEREVLAFTWFKHRGFASPARRRSGEPACARNGESVVRVRPRPDLFWVFAGRLDFGGQRRELMAAALADYRERLRVPDQLKRQVVLSAKPVTAGNSRYSKQRSIYAT